MFKIVSVVIVVKLIVLCRSFDLRLYYNRRPLLVHMKPLTWHQAKQYCRDLGYHLVEIDSYAKLQHLKTFLARIGKDQMVAEKNISFKD